MTDCPSCGRTDMAPGQCEAVDDCPSYFEERGIPHPQHRQFEMVIELRGLVVAESEEKAMEICRETARAIATGDVGHLSDHLIDETEAVRVHPHPEPDENV